MKTRSYIYLALLLIISGAMSCSDSEDQPEDRGKELDLRLKFGTREGGSAYENHVDRIRVIAFDGYALVRNHYAQTSNSSTPVTVREGFLDFYIIANEPIDALGDPTTEYSSVVSTAQISDLTLPYDPTTSNPYRPQTIPMYAQVTPTDSIKDGMTLEVELHRMMARVVVTLKVNSAQFLSGSEPIIEQVEITSLPKQSWLIAKAYPSSNGLINSETQSAVVETTNATETVYKNIFYIPEYIVDNPNYAAELKFRGRIKGTTTLCQWQPTKIGEAMIAPQTRYDILRNNSYEITGNIIGYGQHDLTIDANIEEWSEITTDNILE